MSNYDNFINSIVDGDQKDDSLRQSTTVGDVLDAYERRMKEANKNLSDEEVEKLVEKILNDTFEHEPYATRAVFFDMAVDSVFLSTEPSLLVKENRLKEVYGSVYVDTELNCLVLLQKVLPVDSEKKLYMNEDGQIISLSADTPEGLYKEKGN
jgi:hypothetical protein